MAVAVLGGCVADDGGGGGDGGDGPLDAGDGGDAGVCVATTGEPAWLAEFLSGQVASLAATPRATVAQRNSARGYLQGQVGALGLALSNHAYGTGTNVIGSLPATAPSDRWLVLGAHFDTVIDSPGANDNATGVAVVLAVARAMSAQPCRDANVAFVFFDQEEIGLVGSAAYAASLRAAGTDVIAAHTIDQAGWDADDDLRFELERPGTGLLAKYQAAALAVGADVVPTNVGSTDHQSFRNEGFAAVGLTEEYVSGDTTPHYHQPSDTAATVDAAYHRVAARMMIYLFARELGAPPP
jgi:Zn-dependent M28 family amino/carboxypeptidase